MSSIRSFVARTAGSAARKGNVVGRGPAMRGRGSISSFPIQHSVYRGLMSAGSFRPILCVAVGSVRYFHEEMLPPRHKAAKAASDLFSEHAPGLSPADLKSIQAAFELIDLDENGVIDHEEQAAVQLVLVDAGFSASDVKSAIKEMDLDGNGEISREEFVLWWTRKDLHARNALKIRDAMREFYSGDGQGDDKLD